MVEDTRHVKDGPKRVVWLTLALTLGALVIIGGFFYNREQQNKDAREARLSSESLCIVQNENRAQTRANTVDIYRIVSAALASVGNPDNKTEEKLRQELKRREHHLAKSLKALNPINCETYVRPELPLPTVG